MRCPRLPGLQLSLPGGLSEGTLLDGKVPPPGRGPLGPIPALPVLCPGLFCVTQAERGRLKSWPPRVYCARLSKGRTQPSNEFPDPASLAFLVSVASAHSPAGV